MNEPINTASRFKRTRAITLPTFKFEQDKALYVKFLAAMHIGRVRLTRGQTEPDPDKKPPTLAHVVNIETGEEGQIILAEVLKTELGEAYPNEGYVGRGFEIVKQKRKEGKKYDPYTIAEIELPPEYQSPATPAAGTAPAASAVKTADVATAAAANAPAMRGAVKR